MKYIYSFMTVFLISFQAYAGICVVHDGTNVQSFVDRTSSPKCPGDYYTNENVEWASLKLLLDRGIEKKYLKIDSGLPAEKTSAEKDAVDALEAQASDDALKGRIDSLSVSLEDGVTALIKRINERLPSNKITKKEIIDQIKCDKGISTSLCP